MKAGIGALFETGALSARSLRILVPALALLLAGCFGGDDFAGGDDYPNSVETLGKVAASDAGDTTEWNGWEEAPSTPPEVYDSTTAPDQPPEEAAAARVAVAFKASAQDEDRVPPGLEIAGAVRNVTSVDDIGGLRRTVRVQTILGIEARDTTWHRVGVGNPLRRIERVSGIVTYPAGRTERFSFEDADGDGVLTPLSGSANLSRTRFVVSRTSGRVEERTMVIAAGADLSFEGKADNVLRSLVQIQRVGTDTLEKLVLSPQPGDTAVFGRGRASNGVDVEHMIKLGTVRFTRYYRATVFADSTRNFPRRYRSVLVNSAGTTEVELLGRDSLPDFAPGDTGRARIVFTSSRAQDTLERSETTYRVILGDTAGRHAGHRLLRVDRERVFRFGDAASSRFGLRPLAPVSAGSLPRAGEVGLRVDLRAGGWIQFTGTADTGGMLDGFYVTSEKDTAAVHFDASGAVVSAAGSH